MGNLREWRKYVDKRIEDTIKKKKLEQEKITDTERKNKDEEKKIELKSSSKIHVVDELKNDIKTPMDTSIADPLHILQQKDKKTAFKKEEVITPIIDPYEILSQKDKKINSEETYKIEEGVEEKEEQAQTELPLNLIRVEKRKVTKSYLNEREKLLKRLLDPQISLRESCIILNVSRATLRRYTDKGLIPYLRTAGGQRRFRLSDLLEFQEKREKKVKEELDKSLNEKEEGKTLDDQFTNNG